ncbi:N-acetylmuramoyl-L-alanine amidase [Phenylobacterium sp.]|uniref:N-acetylmuramoyl-L-alanine amidase n=1 Tax=Phenylobacterium sp. TaxID=1871053 RepID=UPI002730843D|nr:N-acetylmuramoyl-L-alanine amidase [Phenylobacterium sp.]MDP1619326.1 N-acetylmuramoyl-L-alanine amidase [Phenylobacterium sp.]MDP1988533.1 N-acetylmuramoyl-L-alanine amidase [Phenylobacterium sp.]
MDIIPAPSPNFNERPGPPDIVVMHYTGMESGEAAIARLRDPEAKVSSHYVVEEDGRIFTLVAEERRAWHAGVSFWKGERDINGRSIGIEIVNPGHEFGYRPFPDAQIAAVIALTADIRTRWMIADGDIIAHSDVAPARKIDPGELFPWKTLAQAGHGLWVEPDPAPGAPLAEGAEGAGVFAFQAGLTRLGYECPPSGQFDSATTTVVSAFQRHWRPHQVDGIADGETRARLIALLRAQA